MADHIYQDKKTGKMIIAGTFTRLIIRVPPPDSREQEAGPAIPEAEVPLGSPEDFGRVGSPWVYLCLTDIRAAVDLELRYVDLRDNKPLIRADMKVECNDPLKAVELMIPMPPLPTPHVGEYSLELLFEEELLGSWRVSVVTADRKQSE